MAITKPPLEKLVRVIWGNWHSNALWQRILKNSLAVTIALSLAVIPRIVATYGANTFLIPMVTVFAHPGQRMGMMVESQVFCIAGTLIGLAWTFLGLYLSSLCYESIPQLSSSIRAVFLLVAVLAFGYIRSTSPRLFLFVWFLFVPTIITLLGAATHISVPIFTAIIYPILTGNAVVLFVNVAIFPEFTTSYLGAMTINTITEATHTMTSASLWFMTSGGDSGEARAHAITNMKQKKSRKKTWWTDFLDNFPNPFKAVAKPSDLSPHLATLAMLADRKPKLRAQGRQCKTAQNEVNFEFSISPLSPTSLKPISKHCMTSLVQNAITLIGACENKYVVLKSSEASSDVGGAPLETVVRAPTLPAATDKPSEEEKKAPKKNYKKRIEDVKPLREVEAVSIDFLEYLLQQVREPVADFERSAKEASALLISCLAYCFDVPKLPSGLPAPKTVALSEVDSRIDDLTYALSRFDDQSAEQLKRAAKSESGQTHDLRPRMEMFLVSSFLMGFRQATIQILHMLQHARKLVEERQRRHDRITVWVPRVADFRAWLQTGGEFDAMVLPMMARKADRTGKSRSRHSTAASENNNNSASDETLVLGPKDEETEIGGHDRSEVAEGTGPPPKKSKAHVEAGKNDLISSLRVKAASSIEWVQHSDDVMYALKLAVAVFLVSWPSFVSPTWRQWYGEIRGIWAPFQLVLIFEVSIGTSFFIFFIRLFGVIFGCTVGYLANVIGGGNRVALVVIAVFGIVPGIYIQLGTRFVKAGMVTITTLSVVSIAIVNRTGISYEIFYKRLAAFIIGGMVAILVEVVVYPVRARDRLVECLSSSVRQIEDMQSVISVGIDGPVMPNTRSQKLLHRFAHARDKAQRSLAAAETFLPFCLNEPRLKGSFKPLEPVYKEIIYVLHQIIDRMDNMIDLRKAYGSSVLEDLNPQVYAYRRNAAASNLLILFSVHEALTTWLPLPQFIPSSRLAQLRLVNRVREVVAQGRTSTGEIITKQRRESTNIIDEKAIGIITETKFLSWNANAAGQMEIIEYLEELVELTKLLVGVNAFRSGMLERPNYKQYVEETKRAEAELQRLHSRQSHRSFSQSRPEETGGSAGAGLGRAAGVAFTANRWRAMARKSKAEQEPPEDIIAQRRVEEAVVDEDEELDDDELQVPVSLQRVGTRAGRDSASTRRKTFTSQWSI